MIKEQKRQLLIILVGVLLSVLAAYSITKGGVLTGSLIIIAVVSALVLVAVIVKFDTGIYLLLFLGSFMFLVDRVIVLPIPLGIVYDALVALTFFAVFLNPKRENNWTLFNNPITFAFIIITAYQLLQFFNPNAVSKVGWLVSMRNNTSFLLYIIFFQFFFLFRNVRVFTLTWLILGLVVALYGIYQEIFGLTNFEWQWIYRVPDRINLYFIWGRMRKFSFLSDPSSYGLFTAFCGLASLAMAFGPYRWYYRLFMLGSSVTMFVAMSFSGTRTAYAMVAVGVVLLILLNLNNAKVVLFSFVLILGIGVVFFGPFYGGTINRIRSTFNPSEDASMAVRDNKRIRLQSYVQSHPIGGGLYTTGANGLRYSRGHTLAQGWDPDSGYLLTALEMGWIGLIIFMGFFFIVLYKGIDGYFTVQDPMLKNYLLVYIVPLFALSVAHFTQDAMFQKPVNLIVIATYALVVRISSNVLTPNYK